MALGWSCGVFAIGVKHEENICSKMLNLFLSVSAINVYCTDGTREIFKSWGSAVVLMLMIFSKQSLIKVLDDISAPVHSYYKCCWPGLEICNHHALGGCECCVHWVLIVTRTFCLDTMCICIQPRHEGYTFLIQSPKWGKVYGCCYVDNWQGMHLSLLSPWLEVFKFRPVCCSLSAA